MLKVLKNEFIKMFSGKKFYILSSTLIVSIILMVVMGKTSSNASKLIAQNFVSETLDGMIMKPIVPIFLVLIIAEVLTEDYTSGTMKFSLISPVKKSELVIGKMLFIFSYAFILMLISFVVSYIMGLIFFGNGYNFYYNLECYASVILPIFSFCSVISFIAIFINSSGAVMGLGIGIYFIMIILERGMENIIYYTFTGGLSACTFVETHSAKSPALFSLTALFYIVLFSILNVIFMNKKDIVM